MYNLDYLKSTYVTKTTLLCISPLVRQTILADTLPPSNLFKKLYESYFFKKENHFTYNLMFRNL